MTQIYPSTWHERPTQSLWPSLGTVFYWRSRSLPKSFAFTFTIVLVSSTHTVTTSILMPTYFPPSFIILPSHSQNSLDMILHFSIFPSFPDHYCHLLPPSMLVMRSILLFASYFLASFFFFFFFFKSHFKCLRASCPMSHYTI